VLRNTFGRLANVMGLDANQPLQLDEIPIRRPPTPASTATSPR
jgi:hypothetical protein